MWVDGEERAPRLVLRFAIFTALGLALATAAIVLFVRQESTIHSQRYAVDRTHFATEAVLKPELRPEDLKARPSAKRRRELDRLFEDRVLLEGIREITLYGATGRATYSTAPGAVGRRAPEQHLREALGGAAVSDVHGSRDGTRVLRTYVPVVLGSNRTMGVAAFEQDYAPIAAAGNRSGWLVGGVLEGALLLLFLIFAPVLLRVTSRIRRHIAEVQHVATHDEVTSTLNRQGFRHAVEGKLASRQPATLLLLDLNGFSEINQAFGSDSGDALLAEVAARLRRDLTECELIARLGEDEFGLLLSGSDPADVALVASRAQESLAPPFLVDGIRVAVSAGMGAAVLEKHGTDFTTVLRRATVALSVAKSNGRMDVEIYDPSLEIDDLSRVALVAELRDALDTGQLLVYYQPQADLLTRQVRGVEALLRWQHPTRGLIAAGEFIAVAERSGIAKELRRFVLETSARHWREWESVGLNLELAVNLSAIDMLDVSLPDEIADLLDRYSIPPWNLVLEITERTLSGDERRTRQVADRLHELGVRLAIDDFGTGYSSLSSLRRFPIQLVKLDRSLLADAPGDAAAEAIASGSVEMAHAIGACVVAEGVETREQWTFVYTLGCDIAQGYLVGRP
ncbi:MAG: bifunctional diguanylate cyclase/phosphodiesterase, partial [Gaiellaceae bacterium]